MERIALLKSTAKIIIRKPFFSYILISVLVCFIDTAIVWSLYSGVHINLVSANSAGVITGFIAHYCLSTKFVFRTKLGLKGFSIYFVTFLIGLVMADWLIYYGEHFIFNELSRELSFLYSKGMSVFIPFLILYFIRKSLFVILSRKVIQTDK